MRTLLKLLVLGTLLAVAAPWRWPGRPESPRK